MHHLSLRGRVLALFSLIMLAAIVGAVLLLISNAREAVRAETAASQELAKKLAIAAVGALARTGRPDTILSDLPVQLQHPRHVRIAILNLRNEPTTKALLEPAEDADAVTPAPAWFDALIRPPVEITRVPIALDGATMGYVVIATEPSDEIAEVWQDFRALLFLMGAASLILGLAVYWALGRSLRPLATIAHGLEQLQSGNYSVRLPEIAVPDLARTGRRFNDLAATLEATIREKEALSQQLVTVQDTERKNIALELHDEFGPCLFGIKVDATFIESEAGKLDGETGPALAERARAILEIVDHMQQSNRALLSRLRPMALGHVGMPQLLEDLVKGFRMRNADVQWRLRVPDDLESCGETADLTIYRMVQECLTNAARHADASEIDVTLQTVPPSAANGRNGVAPMDAVRVLVADNGRGFDPATEFGFGLSGMGQRVKALGGAFSIRPRPEGGTVVSILVPVEREGRAAATTADPAELKGRAHD